MYFFHSCNFSLVSYRGRKRYCSFISLLMRSTFCVLEKRKFAYNRFIVKSEFWMTLLKVAVYLKDCGITFDSHHLESRFVICIWWRLWDFLFFFNNILFSDSQGQHIWNNICLSLYSNLWKFILFFPSSSSFYHIIIADCSQIFYNGKIIFLIRSFTLNVCVLSIEWKQNLFWKKRNIKGF